MSVLRVKFLLSLCLYPLSVTRADGFIGPTSSQWVDKPAELRNIDKRSTRKRIHLYDLALSWAARTAYHINNTKCRKPAIMKNVEENVDSGLLKRIEWIWEMDWTWDLKKRIDGFIPIEPVTSIDYLQHRMRQWVRLFAVNGRPACLCCLRHS
ncbi:hypothetical protein PM082_021683 [Marasmius tenuissimus]|nr:hypothetical protein PM082_021683 [Marasmius tenuissimus]